MPVEIKPVRAVGLLNNPIKNFYATGTNKGFLSSDFVPNVATISYACFPKTTVAPRLTIVFRVAEYPL